MISVFAIRAGRHVREPRQWYTEGRADAVQRILFDIRYLFRPPWDTRISPPELLDYIGSHRTGTALDLGCGTGTNVLTLAAAGWNTSGVDFSRLAICLARRRLRQSGLRARLMAADVTRPLPLAETYDLVLDIGCFHMLRDRDAYMKNLMRLMAIGGHWLMYGFLAEPASPTPMGVTDQDIKAVLSCGLELVQRQDG